MKTSLKDYNTVIETRDVEERNGIIRELYEKGVEYWYTDAKKDGIYKIGYDSEKS